MSLDSSHDLACKEIVETILSTNLHSNRMTVKEVYKLIKMISAKYKLTSIPKNKDILKLLPNDSYYRQLLRLKPIKTSSGIAVITVMPMPFECPHGKCIYCPGGIEANTPLSYIGTEPSTKIAQQVNYDPYLQVKSKVLNLINRGHNTDKAEIVIVGGTFPFYPSQYQINFIAMCYHALNSFGYDHKNLTPIQNLRPHINNVKDHSNETVLLNEQIRLFENKYNSGSNPYLFLQKVKDINETSPIRCVGLTIETKPDYCKIEHVNQMLEFGTTRIELGVQSLNNTVFKLVNRGHTLNDVYEAFYVARNCGYKIAAHMMPGLPGSDYSKDLLDSKKLFEDTRLKPDMLKIYPTVVLNDTGLYKLYKNSKYHTYSTEELVQLLVEIKKIIPHWVRIMRIQREIEPSDVIAGPKMGNLRQLVLKELKKQGVKCKCIRCREIGLIEKYYDTSLDNVTLFRDEYYAARGKEIFLSIESKDRSVIYGFLRLRLLSFPLRKELEMKEISKNCKHNFSELHDGDHQDQNVFVSAVVRELHVYGPVVQIKNTNNLKNDEYKINSQFDQFSELSDKDSSISVYQHKGLGQKLLHKAEDICKNEYNLKKISVISAVGTKEYYKKFGYTNNGPYVTKIL